MSSMGLGGLGLGTRARAIAKSGAEFPEDEPPLKCFRSRSAELRQTRTATLKWSIQIRYRLTFDRVLSREREWN